MPVRKRNGELVTERTLFVAESNTKPNPPRTGKSVPGCYASCLSDCDGAIEGEHFISHGMLKMLAGESKLLNVTGIDPKNPEIERRVAAKRMTADVLCTRHNRILLPIDTAGNRFVETLSRLGESLEDCPPSTAQAVAFSGHDLERWCLKALCGFLARAETPVPELWVRILFGHGSVLPPRGLYFYAAVGDVNAGTTLSLEEVRFKGGESAGVIAQLLNHELVLSMSSDAPVALERHVGKMRVFRPESFTFDHAATESRLVLWLSWSDRLYHAPVDLSWNA